MKIALVAPPYFAIPPLAYGGVEAVVADLADGLMDRGHDVTLLCAGPAATKARELRVWDSPQSEKLGETLIEVAHGARVHRALIELAAGDGFDIVHDHTLIGALLAPAHRVPTVLTAHGPMSPDIRRLYSDLAPNLALVAISHRQRALAPEQAWVATVHNAVRAADWPMRTDAPADADFLVFLGRLHPDKAPHLALDAAHAAGLPLVLAGKCAEPIELDYLEREIRPRLREGDVLFGMADAEQKRDLLSRARALLMPIVWEEPFGMVMIEAMVCGTPVIAFGSGAVPEIVVDGVTGFICDDVASMVQAVGRVETIDPAACRAHVVAHFSVEKMAAGYERAYELALLGRRASAALPSPRSLHLVRDPDPDPLGLAPAGG